MPIVNIPKSKSDQHYRYKRETLELKIEGKGNGIKTVITNMKSVSESLNVPIEYPIKYFGLELAALSKVDYKNDKAVINGKYDLNQVEDALEKFIQNFLLCSKCHLPELDFAIKSNKDPVATTCRACGNAGQIDSTEKLYTTIIKHPPKSKGFKDPKAPAEPVKTSKSSKSQAGAVTEKAAIDDGTWSLDISQEAIKKRREMEGLSERFRELTKGMEDEDEEEEEQEVSPVSILKQFMEADYTLSDKDCVCLLYETFFTPENILTDITKRAPLFKAFISSSGQKLILGYTEELVGMKNPALIPQTSVILLEFYKNSLLSKETMEEWLSKKKSRFVKDSAIVAKIKEAAKPFGDWMASN
ncbi:predicted protein [Naegleria gruberi]|uniref:Predicted protein n=1 Tax=Naegleria gruberi TaxID=5762 RepID=D2VH22_NAEGR|nr:uncharacterized protein NAEGRDRAFT_33969 [Naegleria gruberi]EFC43813.1 predicted protein [Naegleria gruberi]|eukprot:XP_002676557.1 predicted protein [Naegleria gruberi strain NEG-M]